jgi:hypothetical protein
MSGVTIDIEASFNTAENALGIKRANFEEETDNTKLFSLSVGQS